MIKGFLLQSIFQQGLNMENRRDTANRICPFCTHEFSSVSAKNRHLREIHKKPVEGQGDKKSFIICPLCRENQVMCGTYNILQTHLNEAHDIAIEVIYLNFANKETWEQWMEEHKIRSKYAIHRTSRSDILKKDFVCNRSNTTGYESNCTKRKEKAGGTIKIYGVCPSRLTVKFFNTGQCSVAFWKTHVGHEEDIRTHHLSNNEKAEIIQKLVDGVTPERIISDARNNTTGCLQRVNMIQPKDIAYLVKKHNLTKGEHENTMNAVSLKVNEWSANGKNYCFFFKQQDDVAQEGQSNIESYHEEDIHEFIKEESNDSQDEREANKESVLDDVAQEGQSNIESYHEEDIHEFIKEESNDSQDERKIRKIKEIEDLANFLMDLDDEDYDKCMKQIGSILQQVNKSKRKMKQQNYYSAKRNK